LSAEDLNDIWAFNYKADTQITDTAYEKLSLSFPQLADLYSLHVLQKRIAFLSGIKAVKYDCCIKVCMCYTGKYAMLQCCPFCHKARFDSENKPRHQYHYIPIIPRLVALYTNKDQSEVLQTYRTEFLSELDTVKDVFDGTHYKELLRRFVILHSKKLAHKFFSDMCNIALGISFDGFAPFK
ncbi:hypothetical protein C8R44DRAFT_536558, partial [Mycena epipterygia]